VNNLPLENAQLTTTRETALSERLQVGCRLVAALATTVTRIAMR
jgi:hypothetical protein